MSDTYTGENIKAIENLEFFTEKGLQIPMQKTYTITWEIIPNNQIANNFISNPKGHFLYDITTEEDEKPDIYVIIDDPGKVIVCDTTIKYTPDYNSDTIPTEVITTPEDIILLNKTHSYTKIGSRLKNRFSGNIEIRTKTEVENVFNEVKITFNTLTETIEKYYPIEFVFDTISTENVDSTDIDDNNTFTYCKLTDIQLTPVNPGDDNPDDYKNIIHGLIDINFVDYNTLFPCVKYMGLIDQGKISTDLVAASTIIIVDSETYERPRFENSNYKLYFEFQNDSEMQFISAKSIDSLIWEKTFTAEEQNSEFYTELTTELLPEDRPLYFTVGFITSEEGCYQNVMAMYLLDKNTNKKYIIGLITFVTTAEGEDERFRTLLGNFGIPDPAKYPNIFYEQDPLEEGIDWRFINNKSKELMLTYDEIFPYAGTYKALMNAINFLGYHDIIFKEWYRIRNSNQRDKYVAIQTYDFKNKESLEPKLKETNVYFGDYERYKKLNRLTMVYHLNEIDEDTGEYLTVYYKRNDSGVDNGVSTSPEQGLYKAINPTTHAATYNDEYNDGQETYFQLPFTTRIYEYRTTELLAKLYSVKQWLERYIIGVNCYISDICGEGIIVERLKTQAYVTEHHLQDFIATGTFTPKITNISEFQDSSAILTCSLNEFTSLTFGDYEDIPIENFVKYTIPASKYTNLDTDIYVSAPIGALVLAEEYQFEVNTTDGTTGSLEEFTDKDYIDNPILIQDNKLVFYNESKNISKIDQNELPIIEIKQGNIRYCHGNWKDNVKFTINEVQDQFTDNIVYTLYDNESDNMMYKGTKKIVLYPYYKDSEVSDEDAANNYKLYWVYKENANDENVTTNTFNGKPSELIYSAHTKWNTPMLIMRNYICGNTDDMLSGDFILEIIEGNLIFRNHKLDINNGQCQGCNIRFTMEFDGEYMLIYTNYTYLSDRVPIYTFDEETASDLLNSDETFNLFELLEQNTELNTSVPLKVNRLGEYKVSVQAFNAYNNIFTNESDKTYTVYSTPINIEKIINSDFIVNNKDFYSLNKIGVELTDEEKENLFNDVSVYASEPIMPQEWRIYDIDPLLDVSSCFEYDNMSYILNTPNVGDFIIFNNFTEKITYIDKLEDNKFKITLLDENPNTETIKNASNIGLCVYDNIQKEILANIYPLNITDSSFMTCTYDTYDVNNSYVEISDIDVDYTDSSITMDLLSEHCLNSSHIDTSNYFINGIQGYIYNADEILLDITDISVNYNLKETYITDTKQHFVENQNIKICFATEEELHNHYTKNAVDNETTYRIISVDSSTIINPENEEDEITTFTYTLNGIVDLYKLNNKMYHNRAEYVQERELLSPLDTSIPYKLKLCPAHLNAAQYILRVDSYAEDKTLFYNNATIQKTRVTYADKPLLFDNYLDTIYSATIIDYDPDFIKNIWCDITKVFKQTDKLYSYNNIPLTLDKYRTIILRPDVNQTKLTNKFEDTNIPIKTEWEWKSFIIDDQENWHGSTDLVGKQTIFKSVNKILTVKTDLLGTQDVQLKCTDVYGNILQNYGEGSLYVQGDGKTVINRAEQETRNIYYKDVYIVGFESFANLTYPLSADGETSNIEPNIGDNLYGAASDNNVNTLNVNYKIYYNDGTVLTNEGAQFNLLTSKGNISKTNKIKVKANKAQEPHKSKVDEITGVFKLVKTSERDLVKPEIKVNIDVMQYGYSKTTDIFDLTFKLKQIPKEGITLDNSVLYDLVTDVKYKMLRSEGELEIIKADNLIDANLEIMSFNYIDNIKGDTDKIEQYADDNVIQIGTLQLEVKFNVHSIKNIIKTTGICNVYQ